MRERSRNTGANSAPKAHPRQGSQAPDLADAGQVAHDSGCSSSPDTPDQKARRPVRVGLVSLGCAKNLVDGEVMLGTLLRDGLEITNDPAQADVLILNTCSFIDTAQQESVDAILESAEAREANNRGQGLVVAGCLPQRFREELPRLLPEVDAFMGIDQVGGVTKIVEQALARRRQRIVSHGRDPQPAGRARPKQRRLPPGVAQVGREPSNDSSPDELAGTSPLFAVSRRPSYVPDYATPRFRLTPPHFAYLKLAEGCNHPCSFCTIPQMRGAHRSRPLGDIVAEAKALLADGVKELNLISQDSTYYGLDLRPNQRHSIAAPDRFRAAYQSLEAGTPTISSLLRELDALAGDFWIRLLYTHPAHWTDELIQTIGECGKVARYVDIPLQHIHQNMLERMRRETSQEYIVDLLRRIRLGIPGIALRTTFIVGFPGETEAHFGALLDFIRATKFERLGVFTYSREETTRAGNMAGQVPEKIKKQRRGQAMAAQQEVAGKVAESFVNRVIRVLVEKQATQQELRGANVHSWEHGLLREGTPDRKRLRGEYSLARCQADAPDIDGRVYVRGNLPAGQFADVKVVGHTTYDLIAESMTA